MCVCQAVNVLRGAHSRSFRAVIALDRTLATARAPGRLCAQQRSLSPGVASSQGLASDSGSDDGGAATPTGARRVHQPRAAATSAAETAGAGPAAAETAAPATTHSSTMQQQQQTAAATTLPLCACIASRRIASRPCESGAAAATSPKGPPPPHRQPPSFPSLGSTTQHDDTTLAGGATIQAMAAAYSPATALATTTTDENRTTVDDPYHDVHIHQDKHVQRPRPTTPQAQKRSGSSRVDPLAVLHAGWVPAWSLYPTAPFTPSGRGGSQPRARSFQEPRPSSPPCGGRCRAGPPRCGDSPSRLSPATPTGCGRDQASSSKRRDTATSSLRRPSPRTTASRRTSAPPSSRPRPLASLCPMRPARGPRQRRQRALVRHLSCWGRCLRGGAPRRTPFACLFGRPHHGRRRAPWRRQAWGGAAGGKATPLRWPCT